MGKKRIIQKSPAELAKEKERIEEAVKTEKESSAFVAPQISQAGTANIHSSYNNTIITITDKHGNVLCWASAGNIGFKGAKKSTPYAASKVAETVAERAKRHGVQSVTVKVKGIGSGRESAIRSLATHGLDIISIQDVTPIPHGGVRPPKARRV